jgi:hypothetical protein
MARQVWISQQIAKRKAEICELQLAQNLASEEYSKFSIPHFLGIVGDREKCIDCGKLTSWTWNYKPHCKNNNRPECHDYLKERMPLDSTTQSILEKFLEENES